jgi:hypothetical protein
VDAVTLHDFTTSAMASYTNTGTTITSSGNVIFNGTGTLNIGNGITLTGPASTLFFNSTLGAPTSSSCALTLNGTNQAVTDNKGITFKSMTIGNNNYVSMIGSSGTFLNSVGPVLNFGMGVTLYRTSLLTLQVSNTSDATTNVFTPGTDASFGGPGGLSIFMGAGTTNGMLVIPDITGTSMSTLWIYNNGSAFPRLGWTINSINIAGTGPTGLRFLSQALGSRTETFNILGNITTQGTLQVGSTIDGTGVWNWNSANMNVKAVDGTTWNVSANQFHNYQNSKFFVSRGWANGSNQIVQHQWDSVTFMDDATISSSGKPFNYLFINAPGKTVTLADNLKCHGYQRIAGTLNNNGKQVIVTGDYVECQIETSGVS